jgi:hypothetical protein
MNPYGFRAGDKVVFHNTQRPNNPPRSMVITGVGRRWANLDSGYRFDLETLEVGGGEHSSPGRVYQSFDAYEAEMARRDLWRELKKRTEAWSPPAKLKAETIQLILNHLKE